MKSKLIKKILYLTPFIFLLFSVFKIYRTIFLFNYEPQSIIDFFQLVRSVSGWLIFGFIGIYILIFKPLLSPNKIVKSIFKKVQIVMPFIILIVIIIHSLLTILMNFKLKGVLDPFYVYTDICIICKNSVEYSNTLGRISFWVLVTILILLLTKTNDWFENNYKKIYLLFYVTLFILLFHARII